jgi:LysM repeat protein
VKKYLSLWLFVMLVLLITGQVALAAPAGQGGGSIHYVIYGENLSQIAAQYGVSVEAVLRYNGLYNPDLIYVGQPLYIPVPAYHGYPQENNSCASSYMVKQGDTLYSIAIAYNTTVGQLLRLNNFYNANLIRTGQMVCVPTGYYSPQPSYDGDYGHDHGYYHSVSRGETLSGICQRYKVPMNDVIWANQLDNSGTIYEGQQIMIPGYDGSEFIPQPPSPLPAAPVKPPVVVVAQPTPVKPSCGCDKPSCECAPPPPPQPQPIDVYLRLGRNVVYENWGQPKLGLNDCTATTFDDGHPVKRLTAEVILTNHSKFTIPKEWAMSDKVIFHTASGAERAACKYSDDIRNLELKADQTIDIRNLELKADQTINVTFYTHLESNDFVTLMEFTELGICFDPNSGDPVPCSFK